MKHVLFTTTALVVLGSTSAFADVTWSGSADLSYNDGNITVNDDGEQTMPDGINLDVDLDVALSNAGGYTATLSGAMESGGNLKAEDFAVTTPVVSINVGEVAEAANSAYSDISGMAGLGDDEFTGADGNGAILISASAGGMSVAYSDDKAMSGDEEMSSFGISGDLGGVSFGIGSKGDNWGISASGTALGGTIAVASEEVGGESETGVSVSVPLAGNSITVSATDGDDWKIGVSTNLSGAAITASINDNEQSELSLSTSVEEFTLTVAYESGTEEDSEDGNGTQVALSYDLSDSASLTISYNEDMDANDDDDYDAGTSASIGFTF
jgi:hypothetical protein